MFFAGAVVTVTLVAFATTTGSSAATSPTMSTAQREAVRSSVSADPGLISHTHDQSRASRSVYARRSLPVPTVKPAPVHRVLVVAPKHKPKAKQATLKSVATHYSAPKKLATVPMQSNIEKIRQCIVYRESRGDAKARNPSGASGLYQFMDRTWNNFMGYPRAMDAPASVQTIRFYKSWHYWLTQYGGARYMNPWNYPPNQCF
jgi:hypothetical protein